MNPLGRLVPPDFDHVVKFPFSAVQPTLIPVVFGINWYEGFDNPIKGTDGRFRIKISGNVRGGHCICAEPQLSTEQDVWPWHVFYDQGQEGACEGFGHSRALSLIYKRTFDAFWLYDDSRRVDGNFPDGEGAYNRDTGAALVKWGAHFEGGTHCQRMPWHKNAPGKQIAAYHWCHTADEVHQALGYPSSVGEIPLLNSWGTSYPETVYLPLENVQTLLDQEGEASVFVLR